MPWTFLSLQCVPPVLWWRFHLRSGRENQIINFLLHPKKAVETHTFLMGGGNNKGINGVWFYSNAELSALLAWPLDVHLPYTEEKNSLGCSGNSDFLSFLKQLNFNLIICHFGINFLGGWMGEVLQIWSYRTALHSQLNRRNTNL